MHIFSACSVKCRNTLHCLWEYAFGLAFALALQITVLGSPLSEYPSLERGNSSFFLKIVHRYDYVFENLHLFATAVWNGIPNFALSPNFKGQILMSEFSDFAIFFK